MTHRTDLEARYHQHPGDEKPHLHRHGHITHEHDDDGHPVFIGEPDHPRDPATGKYIAKATPPPPMAVRVPAGWFDSSPNADTLQQPAINPDRPPLTMLSGNDLLLAEVDMTADHAIASISDRYLLDLAVEEFDYEVKKLDAVMAWLEAELDGRGRFLDFAEAAQTLGHHPAAAYCYAADRVDPAGAAS